MRVALVSPYSWTYPGGVTRHIEALAAELTTAGHEVRVFAPFDRDVRATALLHRGARPQARPVPEWLVPLRGTIGWPSHGAVSNLAPTPFALSTRPPVAIPPPCRGGRGPPPPPAPRPAPRRKLNHLHLRIAVSEAAAWTGRRFYGGSYRIVPNGVALPAGRVPAPRPRP